MLTSFTKFIAGYGPPDGSRHPCSGISGSLAPRSCRGEHKLVSDIKFLSLRCVSRYTSSVCNASSSSYRRNPDFSKQNRHGYSRYRNNRHNETREEYEDLEDSETLSSKNGPLLSVSGNQKYQATATTGPREKEIVELFRKVQAQLREKAAIKEGKKIEETQAKSKESETVDSLLKLLRKHSVQQGKKSNNTANNKDFILDQDEQIAPLTEERSTSIISDSTGSVKHETQEISRPELTRPKSNFRKRSPVPEIKFQPIFTEETGSSMISMEPEAYEEIQDDEYDSESDLDPLDEILDDKVPEIDETGNADVAKEEATVKASSLLGMKLTELRALAKSRGMKGFSKLKKNELIEVLSG